MQAEDARLLGEFGAMKKIYTQLQHLNRYGQLNSSKSMLLHMSDLFANSLEALDCTTVPKPDS